MTEHVLTAVSVLLTLLGAALLFAYLLPKGRRKSYIFNAITVAGCIVWTWQGPLSAFEIGAVATVLVSYAIQVILGRKVADLDEETVRLRRLYSEPAYREPPCCS